MRKYRKSFVVGILRECNPREKRVALVPSDVKWMVEKGIEVEVESNSLRVFADREYKKAGARIVKRIEKATVLVGVKAPEPAGIIGGKIYMVFSHTVKGQKNNLTLLKEFMRRNDTLIDYEKIRGQKGKRLVHFGKYAGICGMVDSLYYYGRKLKARGISTPFLKLKQSWKYENIQDMHRSLEKVRDNIKKDGFPGKIKPFIVGVIGRGNVSAGVQEVLSLMGAEEVHPRDMEEFVRNHKSDAKKIYMIVFYREEKLRTKTGKKFYFEEYLEHPEKFTSNLDHYLPRLNILVNSAYWDEHYPRMVTKQMLKDLYGKRKFRMEFIGDISCDIEGSIETTRKTTTQSSPVYTYDPVLDKYSKGYKKAGISVLAIDNLPTELPKDSSESFSKLIREYVYQVAEHGAMNVLDHAALPSETRQAVITQGGELAENYKYLKRYFV